MLRPEPMPAAAAGSPADEVDTSCMHCFSRRVGLIAIGWAIVLMTVLQFFTTIEYMTVLRGGALAIVIIYFLINLVDGGLSGLLLLGIRDGVVRVRLNIWLVWNAAFSVLLLILLIVDICVSSLPAGILVPIGLKGILVIGFRVYCLWAGWQFREELMLTPPSASQTRPDMGAF